MDRGKNFFEKKSFPHPFQKTFIRKASSRVPQNEALTRKNFIKTSISIMGGDKHAEGVQDYSLWACP